MAESKHPVKQRERWLLTRKTWRYMCDLGLELIPEGVDPDQVDLGVLEQRFQELCSQEEAYRIWRGAQPRRQICDKDDNQSRISDSERKSHVHNSESFQERSEIHASETNFVPGVGTQTEESEFFDIEWSKVREIPALSKSNERARVDHQPEKTPSTASKDGRATQVFSSAVMKYFGMGRKKTEKNKIDRFKTINYDRNFKVPKTSNYAESAEVAGRDHSPQDIDTSVGIQVGESQVQARISSQRTFTSTFQDDFKGARPRTFFSPHRQDASFPGCYKFSSLPASPLSETATELTSDTSQTASWTTSPRCSITISDEYSTYDFDDELDILGYTESDLDLSVDFEEDFHESRKEFETHASPNRRREPLPQNSNFSSHLDPCYGQKNARQSLPVLHPQSYVRVPSRSVSASAAPCANLTSRQIRPATNRAPAPANNQSSNLNFNSLLSAVMHKSRSGGSLANSASPAGGSSAKETTFGGGHSSRILAKRIWKNRSKSQSRASASSTCIWTPQGSCKWTSITGRQVVLSNTTLLHLTEIERLTLQKVALAKLQALNLGVPIRPPPDSVSSDHKPKRRAHLLRKRALSGGGFFDGSKKESESKGGLVFGVPLDQCIANERKAKLRNSSAETASEAEAGHAGLVRKASHGSRTSFGSLSENLKPEKGGSCESLNADRKRNSCLSCSSADGLTEETSISSPRVPNIVSTCFHHLETHGLNTLGIFRVSSSKKRVRQLREHFDSGDEVQLNEECCCHDIATLLKEFFRDLPEPLLTRELYPAYVQTQRIRNRRLQLEALQHLVQLLPIASRDTLYFLLTFLSAVADKSNDHRAPNGDLVPGNKMDSNNLATLFAPNILHMVKPGTSPEKMAAESAMRADERIDVINVVRCMIDHHKELFELSAELLDEVYIHMMDSHPEALDRLLRRRCQNDEVHEDLDTSSSVFEGSECSSLPRTPTYEDSVDPAHQTAVRKKSHVMDSFIPDSSDQRRYRKREEILHENGGTGGRYVTAPQRERRHIDRSKRMTEPSRSRAEGGIVHIQQHPSVTRRPIPAGGAILKRSDSAESQCRQHPSELQASSSNATIVRPLLCRERSEPTIERRIVMQPVTQCATWTSLCSSQVDVEQLGRRLSSPLVDTSGVITASLKIPVAATSGPKPNKIVPQPTAVPSATTSSFTVDDDHDIPFIEDTSSSQDDSSLRKDKNSSDKRQHRPSVCSLKSCESKNSESLIRQRSGSSDSYLGQPMIGSMQVITSISSSQVVSSTSQKKSSSQDSVLSSASFFSSPPATPLTPTSSSSVTSIAPSLVSGFVSGTSSPLSPGFNSPPQVTPPASPVLPQSPLESSPSSKDAKGGAAAVLSGVVRSKTVDLEKMIASKTAPKKTTSGKDNPVDKLTAAKEDPHSGKKKGKRKYMGTRNHTDFLPDILSRSSDKSVPQDPTSSRGRMTAVLRKRWEIISSNAGGSETFL